MKKLLVILMAVLIPAISFAQRGIPRSNNVSVSVKRVTETTVEKDYKTYNARVGFQQMAGINLGAAFGIGPFIGISYVGGYRFNDWLFVGGGIEYNPEIEDGFEDFNLPVYAQVRTYFTKRIWRPYVSLSLGEYICHNDDYYDDVYSDDYYYDYGFYGDFSIGVDAHVSEKFNVYMALGVNNLGVQLKAGLSF